MVRQFRGWHVRRRRIHLQHVGGRLEVYRENLRGRSENYINQGRFGIGEKKS